VLLRDSEILESAGKIGRQTQLLAEARERKKEVTAQLNADVEVHRTEVDRLGTLLANGYEYRPVECVESRDFESATIRITRTDTGEIVEDRPMTPAERQRELPLDGTESTS
jgi:hypothetical protein